MSNTVKLENIIVQADGQSIDKAQTQFLAKKDDENIDYISLNPYDEDEVEQKFLNSKPTCFLIVGKPGCGKTTIAKKLAEEWRAELVNATDLILKNIESRSDIGKRAQEILYKGESISDSMVMEMLEQKINSSEVAHTGYVLDGFPYQNDDDFDIQKQMEMLSSFKLQPDIIINMKIPDQDLINRRINQKVDPYLGSIYIKEIYAPVKLKPVAKKDDEEGEEEVDEDGEAEETGEEEQVDEPKDEFFAELPADVVERLIKRPEDNEPNVVESLSFYKEAILRALEFKMSNMNQSYLFELDANVSPTILIKQLITRLETHVISKAARPLRLSDPLEISEEEALNNQGEQMETEELMQNITIQRNLSTKFKWRRSKWLRYCPVALKNGQILEGRAEYAAA
jgi:adenylate/nucleoside-diphosphate kinase